MRRALAALAVTLPACLSGFTEIRVVRPDAGTVDAVRADIPAPADASQSPADALDAPSATDVLATPLDAPEVAVPVDVVTGPDVVDAGPPPVDALDVPGEDARDAGELVDRADVVVATDVVAVADASTPTDAGPHRDCGTVNFVNCGETCEFLYGSTRNCGACGNACGAGLLCLRGACAPPTRFAGVIMFPSTEFERNVNAVTTWDARCASSFGVAARTCTLYELPPVGEGQRLCAAIGVSDGGFREAAVAMPRPFLHVREDGSVSFPTRSCRGVDPDSRGGTDNPTMAACCAP